MIIIRILLKMLFLDIVSLQVYVHLDYLVFGSYLDIELLIFFYDILKLRFGDYENFVST